MAPEEQSLRLLARSLELESIEEQGDTLRGEHQGLTLQLRPVRSGLQVRIEAPTGLRLIPSGQAIAGERDLRVGHRELDQALVIQGGNPAASIRLLRSPGVAEALLEVCRQVPGFSVEDGALRAELPLPVSRALLGELIALAQLLRGAEEEEDTRAQELRRTVQPPIRPLRDRSQELEAPPPIHPLHAARWREILRKDRRVALGLGIPLLPLGVGLVWFQAPKWTLVFPLLLIAVMQVFRTLLFRCPGCQTPLERRPVNRLRQPLVCAGCGTRVA